MHFDSEQQPIDAPEQASAQQSGSDLALATPAVSTATAATERRNKGGAPKGNRNAWRHGLHSPRGPEGTAYIDRASNVFRRHLEDGVLAAHGEISVYHAALVQTAHEAARAGMAELYELQKSYAELSHSERTAKRHAALKAMDLRDRKIRELGIVTRPEVIEPEDPFRIIDEEARLSDAARGPLQPSASKPPQVSTEGQKVPPSFSEKLTPQFPHDDRPTIAAPPQEVCR